MSSDTDDGVVIGTGSVSGASKDAFLAAWEEALSQTDYEFDDVEFVGTATRKEDEPGLLEAAQELDLGVVAFDKETLLDHEGPTPSKSKELIGWPGVSEASAIAGGREQELLVEKISYENEVTVAIGR